MTLRFSLQILTALIMSLGLPVVAKATTGKDCEFLTEWRTLKSQRFNDSMSIYAINDAQVKQWEARDAAAATMFEMYYSGQLRAGTTERCLPDASERADFQKSASSIFFKRSLQILESSQAPLLVSLAQKVQSLASQKQGEVFPMFIHTNNKSVLGKNTAAYLWNQRSIYMELDRIPANEWLINFCHELAHALDERLKIATQSNPQVCATSEESIVKHIVTLAQQEEDPTALDPADREILDRWLIASLDRGLLAEYRAWTVTLAIYQQGLTHHLWHPIPLFEKWLAMRSPNSQEPLAKLVLRYLDANFTDPDPKDPKSGVYTWPLVQNELKNLRLSFLQQRPSLYNLADYVEAADR